MPSNLKMEGLDEKEQNISVGNGRFEYILYYFLQLCV